MNPLDLAKDICAFIETGAGDFDSLARQVFAYQFAQNLPYQRFCIGREVTPDTLTSWQEIPAAPASAFKRFALTCAPEADCTPERGGRTFHSSGTTGADTSRHYMDATALDCYRASLKAGYARFVPDEPAGIIALMPPPDDAPHSSLSFMLKELRAGFLWGDGWTKRLGPAWMRVQRKPYTVFGTAFAWVHFFDTVAERFTLPEDCVVIETGGFKGLSREVPRDELYSLFTERLGVPPDRCLAEYGMSEMASQFYSVGDGPKVGLPWVRTRVMDPVTGQEAAPGQPGLLAHWDLANLNSVIALQTEDMGIAAPDGNGFTLLGRAPGAILRGCSLTAEELFAAPIENR